MQRFVGIPITDEANPLNGGVPLTNSEAAEVKKHAPDASLYFSPLAGDVSPTKRPFGEFPRHGEKKDGLFCTLDVNPSQEADK